MMMSAQEHASELDWSAFCYAAGEMTEAEAAAFELRLADDQTAREALARAVELTQAVATAESLEPVVVVRSQPSGRDWNWSGRLGWMALGSAASLLVALFWSGAGSWLGSEPVAAGDQARLAVAWTQTRQELADSDSDLWYPKHLSASESAASDEQTESQSEPTESELLDSVAPSWMTAAVEGYPNEPSDPDSTPFDGERSEN
jgi:hypothetical protein